MRQAQSSRYRLGGASHGSGSLDIAGPICRLGSGAADLHRPADHAWSLPAHLQASLLVQENADPDVIAELEAFLRPAGAGTRRLHAHRGSRAPDDIAGAHSRRH